MGVSGKWFRGRTVAVVAVVAGLLTTAWPAQAAPQLTPSATSLAISPNPASVNLPVTLTATVTCAFPPAGKVAFFDGPTLLANPPVAMNGQAQLLTSFATAGPHQITAAYSGNPNCAASFDVQTLTVLATTTTIAVSTTPTQPVTGAPTTITAVVTCAGDGDPTGSVAFTGSHDGALGASTGTAGPGPDQRTFTVTHTFAASGQQQITATYTSTNPNCAPSGPASVTVTVRPCARITGHWWCCCPEPCARRSALLCSGHGPC